MNSPNVNQSRPWPLWLNSLVFVIVAGILALTLAMFGVFSAPWRTSRFIWLAVILILPIFFYFIKRKSRPSFSLTTIFLVTGLIACGISLSMTGPPWKEVHRFLGYEVNIAMSADGKLVAANQGTSIEIRDTQTGRSVQTIEMSAAEAKIKATRGMTRWSYRMGFANDGKSLVTVDWQTYPCLFDVATGKELRRWPVSGGMSDLAVSGTRFMADSTTLSAPFMQCNVYDVEQDQPVLTVQTNQVFLRSISPTGSHVLIGKDETTKPGLPSSAELWDVDEQQLLGTIPLPQSNPLLFAKFSSDGKLLAIPTSTGLAVWDVAQCRQISQWKPPNFDSVRSLEWSADGSRLVASYIEMIGPSGPVAVAAAMAGKSKRNAIEHYYLLDQECQEIAAIQGASAAFSPSGDRIATVYGNSLILDGKTGELLTYLPSRPKGSLLGMPAFFFSPDGVWLFHNGTPTVYQRTRSERWYSVYQLPAFWGLVLFLSALIVQMIKSIRVPGLSFATPTPQR